MSRPVSALMSVSVALVAALAVLAGCGGQGSRTTCGLDGCTVAFPRSGETAVSVLGIEARLLDVQGGTARLRVAGQDIAVPVGGQTEAGGFQVGVERVTDTEVVVRVRP